MQVKVNSFMLMHEGKLYKAGDVVNIADEDTAKRVVANSGGDFSFADETVTAESDTANKTADKPEVEEKEANDDTDDGGLPDVDPTKAVKK